MRKRGGGCWDWSPCFFRPFNDWEMDEVENFLLCLIRKRVIVDEEDRVRLVESKDNNFSIVFLQSLRVELNKVFPNEDNMEL